MPRISEEVIQEILSKTDIVDLIGETVTLSKKERVISACVPFTKKKHHHFLLNQSARSTTVSAVVKKEIQSRSYKKHRI